ncbi:MAG: YcxB family protein [Desulfovibrio sp.]|nr:MAG: YcxB family protein [Desulfovibrio sp.]
MTAPPSLENGSFTPAAPPLAEVTLIQSRSAHLAAEELYYSTTIYPLLDRIAAGLLMGFGILAVLRAGVRWWTVLWFIIAAAEVLGISALARLGLGLMFKRNPGYGLALTVAAYPHGLETRTSDKRTLIPWDTCRSLLEDKKRMLVIHGSWRYVALPKSAFADSSQLERFRRVILDHVSIKDQEVKD